MSMTIPCNTGAIPNAQGRYEAKEVQVEDLEALECMGIDDGDTGNEVTRHTLVAIKDGMRRAPAELLT